MRTCFIVGKYQFEVGRRVNIKRDLLLVEVVNQIVNRLREGDTVYVKFRHGIGKSKVVGDVMVLSRKPFRVLLNVMFRGRIYQIDETYPIYVTDSLETKLWFYR
ncbi:MAG: hypothetical protein QXT45_06215 [Candidatus Bilamarchaeaceae archaeon]